MKKTESVLRERLSTLEHAVVPGFYGCGADGYVKTFSRGGSDVTGSIVAGAVKASLYENWTDVSGFLVADPRIVDDPAVIRTITYTELRELSIWVHRYCMKQRSFRYVPQAFRSISATPTLRKNRAQ